MILDRVCDVYRLDPDSDDADKESYKAYTPLANLVLNIQPGTNEDVVVAGGAFGQAYVAFTTESGILEGDKIVVQETGEVMIVRGRSNWMSPDFAPHTELLLTEFETSE